MVKILGFSGTIVEDSSIGFWVDFGDSHWKITGYIAKKLNLVNNINDTIRWSRFISKEDGYISDGRFPYINSKKNLLKFIDKINLSIQDPNFIYLDFYDC